MQTSSLVTFKADAVRRIQMHTHTHKITLIWHLDTCFPKLLNMQPGPHIHTHTHTQMLFYERLSFEKRKCTHTKHRTLLKRCLSFLLLIYRYTCAYGHILHLILRLKSVAIQRMCTSSVHPCEKKRKINQNLFDSHIA